MMAPRLWAQPTYDKNVEVIALTDKEDESKPIILHHAIESVIPEICKEFGVDASIFEKKLNQKFNAHFELFKNRKLTEKFGKDFLKELSEDQNKIFIENLEKQKEVEFRKFLRLDHLVDSFAFKSLVKGLNGKWSAQIVFNLNKNRSQKFLDRIFSDEVKVFNKLWVLTEINLIHMTWKDLELESEEQFTSPLVQSWVKWLANNPPQNVDQISECLNDCTNYFVNWLEVPQDQGMKIDENLINNLWMRFSFNLRKISFRPNINEWEIEWDGSAVILDANTKLIVGAFNIPLEKKVWRGLDQKEFNSNLVSVMYRSGLDPLSKSIPKIQEFERFNRVKRLVVQGHQRLGDVFQLMEILKKVGGGLHLESQIDFFSSREAQLLCFYQGEEKSFTDVLSQLKELKSLQRYKILNDSAGANHILKFVAE